MSDANNVFLEKIEKNLEKNGFPAKSVSFPMESLYEAAHKSSANLNKILESLDAKGVSNEKTVDKIIFSKKDMFSADMMEQFKGMDMDNVREKSEQMMNDMPPEQLEYAKQMFSKMSDEEKKDMMAKAMQMFGSN